MSDKGDNDNLESHIQKSSYKSEGERKIAQLLNEYGIPFEYEKGLLVKDKQSKTRIYYPDFYLTDYHIVLEYYGMENDQNYNRGIIKKREAYAKSNLDLIPVYPSTLRNNYKSYIIRSISNVLNHRAYGFQNKIRKKY